MMARLIVGVDRPYIADVKEEINEKKKIGADYFVTPLFRRCIDGRNNVTLNDRALESREWIANIVGRISTWIDLDSDDFQARCDSLEALQREVSWAAHLSLQAILLPTPQYRCVNYARALMQVFTGYQQFYIQIPMMPIPSERSKESYCQDGWLMWDRLRQHFGDYNKHFVALELNEMCESLPDNNLGNSFVKRWCAEPVKLLLLPVHLFVDNHAGYPVLSKRLQQILAILLPHCNQVLLTGESTREGGSYIHYGQYLRHLIAQNQSQLSGAERHVSGYEDTLQAPLQPLMDNLEAQTYETFERDPMKYIKYEEAITRAMEYLRRYDTTLSNSTCEPLVLTVVGAGRGPLVAAALSASAMTSIPVRVYAIEKNPNAVITLRNRAMTEMWSNVTIVATDMREWQPQELCDIMISELLGSFGDNELSPECLDGAQKCLKPRGISIPQSYTSYLAPISTNKLWNMAKGFNLSNSTISDGLNTAYVVRFHSAYQFAEAQPLFAFAHPNYPAPGDKIDNTCMDMVMHGFAGYFETILFQTPSTSAEISATAPANSTGAPPPPPIPPPPGIMQNISSGSATDSKFGQKVMLSTVPQTHTDDMFSWFPLFIPLAQPVRVRSGEEITAHVWRCVDSNKVWYEWCVSSPVCSAVQNSSGKSYSVGL